MKFAAFERTVEFLYKHVVPVPRDQMSKPAQLVVTFTGGYIAGVFCALVSHPADTVVSKLNSEAGSTALQAARDLGMRGTYSHKTNTHGAQFFLYMKVVSCTLGTACNVHGTC